MNADIYNVISDYTVLTDIPVECKAQQDDRTIDCISEVKTV